MFENTSVGVIVDEVRSVLTIDESSVDTNIKGVDENLSDYVQGIIKLGEDDLLKTEISSEGHEAEKRLIIWVDVKKILTGTTET